MKFLKKTSRNIYLNRYKHIKTSSSYVTHTCFENP